MPEQTKTIAESNSFIVLDKYTHKWRDAKSYQSENDLERELVQDLENQGYEYRTDITSQSTNAGECPRSATKRLTLLNLQMLNGNALLKYI